MEVERHCVKMEARVIQFTKTAATDVCVQNGSMDGTVRINTVCLTMLLVTVILFWISFTKVVLRLTE